MPRYAMVIDLQRCGGCGACITGCKYENNLPEGVRWSNKMTETLGTFPHVRYYYRPTLCNHCEKAPCVRGCPTRALHKVEGGITAHDPNKCIGCRYCLVNCPYGVINYTWDKPHREWEDRDEAIPGCTMSPRDQARALDVPNWPLYNPDPDYNYQAIRPTGVVEKCHFCRHRVVNGELPWCVEVCPCDARIFGDLEDPDSLVNRVLGLFRAEKLRPELGTEPRVFYVREFCPCVYEAGKGMV